MLLIGLTGGIGSGKSTVAKLFASLGVPVIDTDIIARQLVEPGQDGLAEIVAAFGKSILQASGQLDRQQLADICFNEPQARLNLEAILHPKIRRAMQQQLAAISAPYAIVVIPLLVETKQQDQVERILLVDCPEALQIERIKQRDQRSEQQIQAIISAQSTRQEKLALADDVIDNQFETAQLEAQVDSLHQKYLKLSQDG